MTSRFLTAAAALALLLTGCDAATDLDALASEDVEDAAAAIAESVALDAGGALDDAASMAAALTTDAAVSGDGVPNRPGCQGDRVYTDAGTWLVSISCERGNPDGLFYHSFARETTWRFLDVEGTPQETPFGATTIEHDVISGTGRHLTPRFSSELESLTSDLTIRAVSDDLASVDGTYERDGVHAVYGRGDAEREVDYALSLDLDEVTGPRGRRDRWAGAVSGTITGLYTATVTASTPGGETRTREVEREFTITFTDAGAQRVARVTIDGQTFDADPASGELL